MARSILWLNYNLDRKGGEFMQLTFEEVAVIGSGVSPDFVEFPKTEGQLFFLDNGDMYGTPSKRLNGYYNNPVWMDTVNITPPDTPGIVGLELKTLPGFGIVGTVYNSEVQKLLIYEYQQDVSKYFAEGSIRHNIENPISTFTATFDNPIDEDTEYVEQVILNEHKGLLSPGAKISFHVRIGDEEPVEMGTFYVDTTDYKVKSATATVDGRNLIGKILKDQTLNEVSNTGYKAITNIISDWLEYCGLSPEQYLVEATTEARRFKFEPNKTVLQAIEEVLKTMVDWKIEQDVDGTIVIGSPGYAGFPQRSTYTFNRGEDIFSRNIKMDDAEAYRKVCVHDKDWNIEIYELVQSYSGWSLQSNKTLFVQVPDGTSQANAQSIATELASRLENVGKIETFTGPFRPQLMVGDAAQIVEPTGQVSLGLITEVNHTFGKNGFVTTFVVDSGGRLGKSRLKDYIQKIQQSTSSGSIAYEDIAPPEA